MYSQGGDQIASKSFNNLQGNEICAQSTSAIIFKNFLQVIVRKREKERELLRHENQHLREMIDALNERVLEKEVCLLLF